MTDPQFDAEVDTLELRYMRGWIGLGDFRVAMVELYDRADREDHTVLHPSDPVSTSNEKEG